MDIRTPAVAGSFYPGARDSLTSELENLMGKAKEKIKAIGVVSPHAGYVYSGAVAGELLSCVIIPRKVILLGPNHTGLGSRASIMLKGAWDLPNGTAVIDSSLAEKILQNSDLITADIKAHIREHSLEVQIPFLLHERQDVKIVPVTLMGLGLDDCKSLGLAIAEAVRSCPEDVLIVASSDMTHYESQESATEKDRKAIERVLSLDPVGLLNVVAENSITMCGVIPTAVMLFAATALGAKKASLIRYATSGDVSGDYDQVVGYAGMVVA